MGWPAEGFVFLPVFRIPLSNAPCLGADFRDGLES